MWLTIGGKSLVQFKGEGNEGGWWNTLLEENRWWSTFLAISFGVNLLDKQSPLHAQDSPIPGSQNFLPNSTSKMWPLQAQGPERTFLNKGQLGLPHPVPNSTLSQGQTVGFLTDTGYFHLH